MCSRFLRIWFCGTSVLGCLVAASETLRVCADPNNLPLSNAQQQGFENKLAELVAAKLGYTLEYTWWAQRKSFIRHSLDEGRCDVLMEVPSSLAAVDTTEVYYRSTYVFVSRHDRNLQLKSLFDERLSRLRIALPVVGDDYAPPAVALAARGITANITGFSLFAAEGETDPARHIIDAVEHSVVDVAIVWGPLAGYFAKSAPSALDIEPVSPPAFRGIPFTYGMAMGVRKGNTSLRASLNDFIAANTPAIQRLLVDFAIPQLP